MQITDPHLYDPGAPKEKCRVETGDARVSENLTAFRKFIDEINRRQRAGPGYKFVAVTGDLGIEALVKPLLGGAERTARQQTGNDECAGIDEKIVRTITAQATILARELARSEVALWLFIPGNNDLIDERLDTLQYYHCFMKVLTASPDLRGKVRVEDLCPALDSDYAAHVEGLYSFIGFNNASFKNNNDITRVDEEEYKNRSREPDDKWNPNLISDEQARLIGRARNLVEKAGPYVYIFYHIPEVDDPYLVSGGAESKLLAAMDGRIRNSSLIGGRYLYSSWFVPSSVRQAWDELIHLDKIKGLFAGHLHDSRRETYQGFRWMRSFDYSFDTFTKLYICPPLAVKRQENVEPQARGFQEISINAEGLIRDEQGTQGVQIVWYEPACDNRDAQQEFTDDSAESARSLNRQLSIAQLLETQGRLPEAEAVYARAAALQTNPLAEGALQRVGENRRPDTMSTNTMIWLSVIGSLGFGIVIGWITHRTLRRSTPSGLSDIATVIGAIGGAAVTGLFRRDTGDFGAYCIGLLIGFFAYLIVAIKTTPRNKRATIGDWLGTEQVPDRSTQSNNKDDALTHGSPASPGHADDHDTPVPT